MNLFSRISRVHLAAVAGVVLAVGTGMLLYEPRFGKRLENYSYDLLGKRLVNFSYDLLLVARWFVPAEGAVMVYLDDVSYEQLHQPLNVPWDHSLHADLIKRLTSAGARAIAFDMTFTDPNVSGPAGDERMAAAMKQSGRVILAADNVKIGKGINKITPPLGLLRNSAASIGSSELDPDADLVSRKPPPERQLPSLSWACAEFLGAKVTRQEEQRQSRRWMNYYGPPNSIPGASYYAALDASQVPDEFFRGKVVFVGGRLLTKFGWERKDEYPNPFSFWLPAASFTSGAEIQATAFLNLVNEDWLRSLPMMTERLVIIALGLLFGYGLVLLNPLRATVFAALGLGLVLAFVYVLFRQKLIWFPWLIVAVQAGVALSWSVLFNSVQLYVQKRLYEYTLGLYLSPKLVKKFAKSAALLKPGAEKQALTLFFSDIADFTTMSEGMDSNELSVLMNSYFETAVSKCIHKADGTVAKYIGDSIFAFWNAPDAQADHPLRACEAALLFREQVAQAINGHVLRTRIGLHTGVANVGNFGSQERVDYTALGENVNLASRLEGLNKHLGTNCLISGATKAGVGDRVLTRALGKFQLKGFEGLVEVHELIGRLDQAEATRAWREAFAEALNNYEQRNLEFAEIGFQRVLELKPEDGPTKFYLKRVEELAKEVLPENWATHTVVKEK